LTLTLSQHFKIRIRIKIKVNYGSILLHCIDGNDERYNRRQETADFQRRVGGVDEQFEVVGVAYPRGDDYHVAGFEVDPVYAHDLV